MIKYFVTNNDPICGVSVCRLEPSGVITWLGQGVNDEEYVRWLSEGNTPEEWKPE